MALAELAEQLEQVYRSARAKGASHAEAVARTEAEVPDWQTLARDVLDATYTDRGRLVAVITERTARAIWPGEDPVGRVFSRSRGDRTWEVVGVVGDARIHGLDREPGLVAYPAYWDGGTPSDMTLVQPAWRAARTSPTGMLRSV